MTMDRETARRAQLPVSHQIILREIEHAADQGAPCPSNGALCGLAGYSSVSTPVQAIRSLEKRGFIAVERFQCARRVTIVATGAKTAEPLDQVPHWREREQAR